MAFSLNNTFCCVFSLNLLIKSQHSVPHVTTSRIHSWTGRMLICCRCGPTPRVLGYSCYDSVVARIIPRTTSKIITQIITSIIFAAPADRHIHCYLRHHLPTDKPIIRAITATRNTDTATMIHFFLLALL